LESGGGRKCGQRGRIARTAPLPRAPSAVKEGRKSMDIGGQKNLRRGRGVDFEKKKRVFKRKP